MNKLYDQNDKIILLREELDGLYAKQKDLQAETAAAVIDFQDFLKEQEQVCNNKLAQSNPEIARYYTLHSQIKILPNPLIPNLTFLIQEEAEIESHDIEDQHIQKNSHQFDKCHQ